MNDQPDSSGTQIANSPDSLTSTDLWRIALAEVDKPRAATVTNAHEMAGKTIGKLTSTAGPAVVAKLEEEARAIAGGDLAGVEGRLASQAVVLDALFHHLTNSAIGEPNTMDAFTSMMKLALRAQAQSASTLAALAEIKNGPRVVVTRQLNAASQQIVNNGPAAAAPVKRARAVRKPPPSNPALPEPSPLSTNAPMDTRSPREAAPAYPMLDAVDPLHRPAH